MKKFTLLLPVLTLLFSGRLLAQQTLVHYWNFNDATSESTLLTPNVALVPGGSITHIPGTNSEVALNGTGQNFDINNYNARNVDPAGAHLRFNNPIDGVLEFALPTTGYRDVVVQFATRRSSTGAAAEQYWSYSVNGVDFIAFDTIYPFAGDPTLEAFDFDGVSASDNNPNFKLRVEFGVGGPTTGNNRFDNFTLDGSSMIVPALVHYWNFNDVTSESTLLTPNVALVAGSSITHIPGANSEVALNGTGQNFDINNYNTRNGDIAGAHLRFNNPIDGVLEFALPTTGHKDAKINFSTRRSSTGAAAEQYWSYSVNGVDFTPFDTIYPFAGDPNLEELDFDNIPATDDNADFKLRVEFGVGGPTTGNNRFDNFTLDATPLSGQDLIPPTIAFNPINNSVNVAINSTITLTFNEDVRLINDTPLNDINVASVVELRLDNASGAVVPFSTTFSNNVITITPDNPLLNSQEYYVALLGGTVEDLSDNDISGTESIQFTTISLQTQFTEGDMVIVAYRMNSTGTEDEIAILTLVDIIPGTLINITDSKYTSNGQPQCAGGLVWTAPSQGCIPAGTTIYIQTSEMVANIGTLTGSGFGLSSGGDQVIIYTGTASNPNYITALTSIDWELNNTSCGGSLSMIPNGLVDGVSSLNTSTAPGNTAGNSVNAYYNGTQVGNAADLRTAILNPSNWIAIGGGTAPQVWPNYNFPAPPTVRNATVLSGTSIQLVFNSNLDQLSATDVNNYTGISGLINVSITNNGSANDTVTLTYATNFLNGTSYALNVDNVLNAALEPMGCAYEYLFAYNTSIGFDQNFIVVNENQGNLEVQLNFENPSDCLVDLEVLGAPYSTADALDFNLINETLIFTPSSISTQFISIPITDDIIEEQHAEYFVLALRNPVGCAITGDTIATIYIKDNDRQAPTPNQEIELTYVSSFDPSGSNSSTCEVVSYDAQSERLVSTSAVAGVLDIIDFSNPASPSTISSIDMSIYGGITSVSVKNGIIAVASPNANEQLDGSVVFFDINGNFLSQVTVGALPDMITFTPDGTKVLTANEGQPSIDYAVDPEGSVSIIDVSSGVLGLTQANVNTLYFTAFNAQEATLIASGVRKTQSTSSLSQDLEPEYITIDAQSSKAWVSLQENNAIAEIDLNTAGITEIWALGTKDVSVLGNGYDVSDNNNEILIANWPIKSFYQPDALGHYSVNGTNYILTANEGDEKEYNGLDERTTVGSSNYNLDPTIFPNADVLKKNYNLGRMRVSNLNGDIDGDLDFDEIYSVGSRSFSIFNADSKSMVFDSGDDFEMYTALTPAFAPIFNSNHEENSLKNRSRAKGPEPEGITIAQICDRTYGFISLERIGGVMVYNITDPSNVTFVDYKNPRSTTAYTGDHGPETMIFIPRSQSPDGLPYIIVANEISGTLSIFMIQDNAPAQTTSISASICQGETYTFGTNDLTVDGTYAETFTNIFGCDSIVNLSLTVNPLPAVDAGTNLAICIGDTVTLTGSGANSYSWDNGVTDGVEFYPIATETYTLTGTDTNNCVNTSQIDIVVNNLPTVDAGLDTAICDGDGITLSGSGASSYSWDNSVANGIEFFPTATLTYTVTGTDVNNCSNTDDMIVTVKELPTVDVGEDTVICTYNFPVSVTANGNGLSYSWNDGTNGATIQISNAGTYTVTATLDGCENTDSIEVISDECAGLGEEELAFNVYPNPFDSKITIELSSIASGMVSIFSAEGRLMEEFNSNLKVLTISTKEYPEGVYFIHLNFNTISSVVKVIKH